MGYYFLKSNIPFFIFLLGKSFLSFPQTLPTILKQALEKFFLKII